jgi:hypothetical protein
LSFAHQFQITVHLTLNSLFVWFTTHNHFSSGGVLQMYSASARISKGQGYRGLGLFFLLVGLREFFGKIGCRRGEKK